MLKLIKCEFLKLKRKPLVFISLLLSVFMPLAYAFFLADVNTDVDAVNGVMSSLFPSQCLFAFDAAPCDTGFQSAV